MLPNYPIHIQVCRVTATTVSGPTVSMSSSLSSPIHVSFTQQLRSDTLIHRDREPCLVFDPNGDTLAAGHYICRLVGSYTDLPLYAAVGSASGEAEVTADSQSFITLADAAGWNANASQVKTWTCPTGVTSVDVFCVGHGGLGRIDSDGGLVAVSGGGGGGAFASKRSITVVPGTIYDIEFLQGESGYVDFDGQVRGANGKAGVSRLISAGAGTAAGGAGGAVADSIGTTRKKGGNGGSGHYVGGTDSYGGGGGGSAWDGGISASGFENGEGQAGGDAIAGVIGYGGHGGYGDGVDGATESYGGADTPSISSFYSGCGGYGGHGYADIDTDIPTTNGMCLISWGSPGIGSVNGIEGRITLLGGAGIRINRLVTQTSTAKAIVIDTKEELKSGFYLPTLTNVANLAASTAYQCQFMRVGNTVTVSGKVSVDPTVTVTATRLGISLPIASNLVTEQYLGGVAFAKAIAGQGAAIYADTTNDRAQMEWLAGDITNQDMWFTFTYRVQ